MARVKEESEAYEELKKFIENKFKLFDYNIIVGLARIKEDKNIESIGFTFSSVHGGTAFGTVKAIIANTIA